MTLAEYVAARGYGDDLLERYLVPMSSAVWSTPPELMLEFPATTLLRFWHNHGFLGLEAHHPWRTVVDGSRSYVKKISVPFSDRIRLSRKAIRVTRMHPKVQITFDDGETVEFDKVILACHGDQALALLSDPTDLESSLLAQFKYQPNTALIHRDTSVMPKTPLCWASWNYRLGHDGAPTTHYWMNRLQGVSDREPYFVSLNAEELLAPDQILRRIHYEHPLFNRAAIAAQKSLPALNRLSADQTTFFAGAWFKYGFHEDGFTSALECARAVTGEVLWT
jgi:predicted NAD/FAD-binding protein